MNKSILHLSEVAGRAEKRIVGLMSGTSLDGLDLACCIVKNSGRSTDVQLEHFATHPYSDETAGKISSIVSRKEVFLQNLCLANTWLADLHSDMLLSALESWGIDPGEVDCVASHGQTAYHAPVIEHEVPGMPNATLQVADGDHIARKTGILTLSDFRQKHTAAGGEGAPMVALVDRMLFTHPKENRFLLNIGGIANFTYLPALESDGSFIMTDTGPGNTLINAAVKSLFEQDYDSHGEIAGSGTVNANLVKALKDHSFFGKSFPKSTGPELFNLDWVSGIQQEHGLDDLPPADLVATLTWLTAESIADAIRSVNKGEPADLYLSGGGIYNDQLVEWLNRLLSEYTIESFETIGFNPNAKEAVSFAVMANETLSGEGFLINPKQGVERRVNFGKISLPV